MSSHVAPAIEITDDEECSHEIISVPASPEEVLSTPGSPEDDGEVITLDDTVEDIPFENDERKVVLIDSDGEDPQVPLFSRPEFGKPRSRTEPSTTNQANARRVEMRPRADSSRPAFSSWKRPLSPARPIPKQPELFVIDNAPAPEAELSQLSEEDVPSYQHTFYRPVQRVEKEAAPVTPRVGGMCFNCGGKHPLSKCQEKINWQKVKIARDEQAGVSKFRGKKKDIPEFDKFHIKTVNGQLRPGQISDTLSEALGIKPGTVPPYIYMMRNLGYPPGWLLDAKVDTDTLEIHEKGGHLPSPSKPQPQKNQGTFDVGKLYDYPGFNSSMPQGVKDEYKTYKVKPLNPDHSKEKMVQYLSNVNRHNQKSQEPAPVPLYKPFEVELAAQEDSMELSDDDENSGAAAPIELAAPASPDAEPAEATTQEEEEPAHWDMLETGDGEMTEDEIAALETKRQKLLKMLEEEANDGGEKRLDHSALSLSYEVSTALPVQHRVGPSLENLGAGMNPLVWTNVSENMGMYARMQDLFSNHRVK